MNSLFFLFSFLFSGCSDSTDNPSSSSSDAPVQNVKKKTESTDNADSYQPYDPFKSDNAELAKTPLGSASDKQSIVALGGNITETLYALGLQDRIAGVDLTSKHPPEAAAKPQVGYFRRVSAEGVISLSPDIVLAADGSGPPDALEKIKGLNIPIVTLSDNESLKGAMNRIAKIATMFDRVEAGKKIIAAMNATMQQVKKPKSKPKTLFIYARGAGTLMVAGEETGSGTMISLAGGENAVQGYKSYKPMNAEAIVAAAPDFILLTSRGLQSVGGIEAVKKMQGVSMTPAAKNNNIIAIDDMVLLGFGPRMADGILELSQYFTKAEKGKGAQ